MYEFVSNLFDNANDTPCEGMNEEQARQDLMWFENEGWDIPEGATPEEFAEIWNELCLANVDASPKAKRIAVQAYSSGCYDIIRSRISRVTKNAIDMEYPPTTGIVFLAHFIDYMHGKSSEWLYANPAELYKLAEIGGQTVREEI